VAAGYPPGSQPDTLKQAKPGDCLVGILRAGGGKAAVRWHNLGQGGLVKFN
jgi:hypothetical protein